MKPTVQGMLPLDLDHVRPKPSEAHLRGVPVAPPVRRKAGRWGLKDADAPGLFGDGPQGAVVRRDGAYAGQVRRILHFRLETGYHVLSVALEDEEGMETGKVTTFVGTCQPVAIGDRVEADGEWEMTAKFGRQLRARFIRVLAPSTAAEIHAFLRNGGVKGIGKKTADKLLAHFGEALSEVMGRPTTLMAAGLLERQAETIARAWSQRTTHTEALAFLQALSIGPVMSDRIISRYGDGVRRVVTEDPYRMMREVSGLGFKTADQIAMSQGVARDDARRVNAGILHAMSLLARDGHCACPRGRILKSVRDLLTLDDRDIKAGIARLIEGRQLLEEEIGGSVVIYEAGVQRCEEEIADRISERLEDLALPDEIEAMIAAAALEVGIAEIHEHQALAVRTSLAARVSVITGGPGAGKTSSLEVLLRVFEALNPGSRIALCAPTGRAAQRMAESTGREASTIHRLLEWAPDRSGFQRNEDNPIDADLVVVDESSMLDIWLSRDLLRAVAPEARIVFVGDVDQLPSVGAGRVLGDVIESGVVPVTRLTRIFRQGKGSLIADAARLINAGRVPDLRRPTRETDMWAIWEDDPEVCLSKVVALVRDIGPKLGLNPFEEVQVLTSGHGGSLGTIALNRALQEALNPEDPEDPGVEVGDIRLRPGDRVIQTSNNYDLDVFNGDIGRVVRVMDTRRRDAARVVVAFDDREVSYSGSEARELGLAYAITVHKSQGSEFPFVIFALSTQHFAMLRKTLVYTAVTRARRFCAVVGQDRAMRIAVKQADAGRTTGLARRLALRTLPS